MAAINGIHKVESNNIVAINLFNQIIKESSDGNIIEPTQEKYNNA
jgi:hypothetical protein